MFLLHLEGRGAAHAPELLIGVIGILLQQTAIELLAFARLAKLEAGLRRHVDHVRRERMVLVAGEELGRLIARDVVAPQLQGGEAGHVNRLGRQLVLGMFGGDLGVAIDRFGAPRGLFVKRVGLVHHQRRCKRGIARGSETGFSDLEGFGRLTERQQAPRRPMGRLGGRLASGLERAGQDLACPGMIARQVIALARGNHGRGCVFRLGKVGCDRGVQIGGAGELLHLHKRLGVAERGEVRHREPRCGRLGKIARRVVPAAEGRKRVSAPQKDLARQAMPPVLVQELIISLTGFLRLAEFLLRDAEGVQDVGHQLVVGVGGSGLLVDLLGTILLAQHVGALALIEQRVGAVRRLGVLVGEGFQRRFRVAITVRLLARGEAELGDAKIEIRRVEELELGLLLDQSRQGVARLGVLTLLVEAHAEIVHGVGRTRVLGEILEKRGPCFRGQVIRLEVLKSNRRRVLPRGRAAGLLPANSRGRLEPAERQTHAPGHAAPKQATHHRHLFSIESPTLTPRPRGVRQDNGSHQRLPSNAGKLVAARRSCVQARASGPMAVICA